jgi:prenyltransferase beta subunit
MSDQRPKNKLMDQALQLLQEAVSGLIKNPGSVDDWYAANYCLRAVASLNAQGNPYHYEDKHESD